MDSTVRVSHGRIPGLRTRLLPFFFSHMDWVVTPCRPRTYARVEYPASTSICATFRSYQIGARWDVGDQLGYTRAIQFISNHCRWVCECRAVSNTKNKVLLCKLYVTLSKKVLKIYIITSMLYNIRTMDEPLSTEFNVHRIRCSKCRGLFIVDVNHIQLGRIKLVIGEQIPGEVEFYHPKCHDEKRQLELVQKIQRLHIQVPDYMTVCKPEHRAHLLEDARFAELLDTLPPESEIFLGGYHSSRLNSEFGVCVPCEADITPLGTVVDFARLATTIQVSHKIGTSPPSVKCHIQYYVIS